MMNGIIVIGSYCERETGLAKFLTLKTQRNAAAMGMHTSEYWFSKGAKEHKCGQYKQRITKASTRVC